MLARVTRVRLLSFQVPYACRHSGACCSAGWIEPKADGVCRHFDGQTGGGCAVQRASGHGAVPHACQQFPRVATLSPLGTSVTLSAFCPTAASLLFGSGPFAIASRDDTRVFEGLDARGVLPPLLRDGLLMDWESVARWEELAVATLSDHRGDLDRALGIIEAASLAVCERWSPADGALDEALNDAFRARAAGMSAATPLKDRRRDRPWARPQSGGAEDVPGACASSAPIARFLASHAFACWPMYDGHGIAGAVERLRKAQETLEEERGALPLREAVRQADLRLRHTA